MIALKDEFGVQHLKGVCEGPPLVFMALLCIRGGIHI